MFEVNLSTFKNREYIKGYVKAICPNYDNLSPLKPYAFNACLDNLCKDEGECEYITKNLISQSNGIGTLYVVNDVDNLRLYPQLNNIQKSFLIHSSCC